MPDTMIEIDIEEIFFAGMGNTAPVLPVVFSTQQEMVVFDGADIESFTSTGIVERLVYRLGECKEFEVDDFWLSMGSETRPVIRDIAVNAGTSVEIPLGAKLGLPGDTLRILDFEENAKTHIVNIIKGLIKSWTIHDDGSLPTAAQTHEVVIQDGLITQWSITAGGIRATRNHSIEVIKGLVKEWDIT